MILKLPFKKLWYYEERPIDIRLRLGSLEDLCDELDIKFWQIKEYMTKNDHDFSVNLLYHGYVTACEKNGIRVKYSKVDAAIWYEYMSATERIKFTEEIKILFGKIIDNYQPEGKKKAPKKTEWHELKSFALGELGWSLERWRNATIEEFNLSAAGYWRNWERDTGWLMREVVYTIIAGNPYIKTEDKPKKDQIIKLSIDKGSVKKEEKKLSPEDIEKIRQELISRRDK